MTALAFFTPPDPKNFGWDGGCGDMLCTGKNNYLIHDFTGGFIGEPGILIANNSEIGDNSEKIKIMRVLIILMTLFIVACHNQEFEEQTRCFGNHKRIQGRHQQIRV